MEGKNNKPHFFNHFKLTKKRKRHEIDLDSMPRQKQSSDEQMEEENLKRNDQGKMKEEYRSASIGNKNTGACRIQKMVWKFVLRRRTFLNNLIILENKLGDLKKIISKVPKIKEKCFLKESLLMTLFTSAFMVYFNGLKTFLELDLDKSKHKRNVELRERGKKVFTDLTSLISISYSPLKHNKDSLFIGFLKAGFINTRVINAVSYYTNILLRLIRNSGTGLGGKLKEVSIDYFITLFDAKNLILYTRFATGLPLKGEINLKKFFLTFFGNKKTLKTIYKLQNEYCFTHEGIITDTSSKIKLLFYTGYFKYYVLKFISKKFRSSSITNISFQMDESFLEGLEISLGYVNAADLIFKAIFDDNNNLEIQLFTSIVDNFPLQINKNYKKMGIDSQKFLLFNLIHLIKWVINKPDIQESTIVSLFTFLSVNLPSILTKKWFKMIIERLSNERDISFIIKAINFIYSKKFVKFVYESIVGQDYSIELKGLLAKTMIIFFSVAATTNSQVLYQSSIISISSNSKFLTSLFDFISEGMEFKENDIDFYNTADVEINFNLSFISLFLEAYKNYLTSSLFNPQDKTITQVISNDDLPKFVTFVKNILLSAFMHSYNIGMEDHGNILLNLMIIRGGEVLTVLYEHNQDSHFIDKKHFLAREDQVHFLINILALADELTIEQLNQQLFIVTKLPFCYSFDMRYHVFRKIMASLKMRSMNYHSSVEVKIRRDHLVEDGIKGFKKFFGKQSILRGHIKICYIDELGMYEAGIDTGGMFKEFLYDMAKNLLNPDYGLFSETQDRELDPNNESRLHVGPEHLILFYFVGVVIGRAIYDEILIDNVFSRVLLRRMLGKINLFNELRMIDLVMYKQLLKVKNYKGNVEDLVLSFSTMDKASKKEIDLIRNGSNIPVTNNNKIKYIYYLSYYILNVQNKKQTQAFLKGLADVIPLSLLKIFTAEELQVIISGESAEISISDLRLNTVYKGGYTQNDLNIKRLWEVLSSFNTQEKVDFLKFVTNCRRPPIFGFKGLSPKFTIQLIDGEDGKLPVASVCFNTLKLPRYKTKKKLEQKLKMSIEQGKGYYIV